MELSPSAIGGEKVMAPLRTIRSRILPSSGETLTRAVSGPPANIHTAPSPAMMGRCRIPPVTVRRSSGKDPPTFPVLGSMRPTPVENVTGGPVPVEAADDDAPIPEGEVEGPAPPRV